MIIYRKNLEYEYGAYIWSFLDRLVWGYHICRGIFVYKKLLNSKTLKDQHIFPSRNSISIRDKFIDCIWFITFIYVTHLIFFFRLKVNANIWSGLIYTLHFLINGKLLVDGRRSELISIIRPYRRRKKNLNVGGNCDNKIYISNHYLAIYYTFYIKICVKYFQKWR